MLIFFFLLFLGVACEIKHCSNRYDCARGLFCNEGRCRRDACSEDFNCESDEQCRPGIVNGRRKTGCFRREIEQSMEGVAKDYCPGGGAVVLRQDGTLSTCDLTTQCTSTHICNPLYGVCCTKIRTCPKTAKTMINFVSGKPIMCQIRGGREMPCPNDGYCEVQSGFCCVSVAVPVTKPIQGQVCEVDSGCVGNAACVCKTIGNCKCECQTEFGYTVASDGKSCIRQRRRLKEKCKTDLECSSAYSECSSGGCRCKRAFQRDGNGGCKPVEYRCVNKATPLKIKDKMITCSVRSTVSFKKFKKLEGNETEELMEILANSTFLDDVQSECPSDYYCVPVFDDATRPGSYKGFCCPRPSDARPVCPVGEPHSSSSPPEYGCTACPDDHYCHRDHVATDKSICCPKACISMDDIYHDGQCFSTAFHGDSCHVTAQCSNGKNGGAEEYAQVSKLECLKGICSCPSGFSFSENQCKRIMCSIGLRGEPSVDKEGSLLRCARSSDCSMGHMCDPNNKVCCRGTNRCPKGYVETGEQCENGSCNDLGQMCHWTKNGKAKICCQLE